MARSGNTGKAQAVTTEDFNARVKRLMAEKPDPRKAEERRKSFNKTPKPARPAAEAEAPAEAESPAEE